MSINAHQTIYVITPELNSESQLLFRENLQPMLRGKHVLILMASVTTGLTIARSMECVRYYGGKVVGVSAIYSATSAAADGTPSTPVSSVGSAGLCQLSGPKPPVPPGREGRSGSHRKRLPSL